MSDKGKALSAALSQIERQFGKGSVMRMGDRKRERMPSISTGSLGWTSLWELAVCRKGVSWKSTGRNPPVKPP